MRQGIHPDYVECTVTCSCGSKFVTRATVPELHIELCSQCHPFYTGTQKFVDTGGRVQRFEVKFGEAASGVMEREAAAREARQKAHEESVVAAREARTVKEASKAEHEPSSPAEELPEEPVAEAAPEEPVAEEAPAESEDESA